MSLKLTYPAVYTALSQNPDAIEVEINKIKNEDLSQSEIWHRGLAVLSAAADQLPAHQDEVYAFYRQLVTKGLDFKASVYLADEEYAFHLETLIVVLHKLAPHFPIVYTQIAYQYRDARRGYKDSEKVKFYLDQSADLGVELAVGVKGYFMQYGIEYDKDEAAATALLNQSDSVWNRLYRGLILLIKRDFDTLPEVIAGLKRDADEEELKSVLTFEANYFDAINDTPAAIIAYQHIYSTYNSDHALFRLASIQHGAAESEEEKRSAMQMWKDAFELGTIDAANYLGYNSLPEEAEVAGAYDAAIHWFGLGYLYNDSFSAYRLALIYLFVPAYQDNALGMHYLDEAIKNRSLNALVEKAELLIDGNIYEKDEAAAVELLRKAEQGGLPYAINRLGDFYERGILVTSEPDVPTALTYYLRAAELDYPGAIDSAGRVYRYGLAGEADPEKAKAFYERGAALNSVFSITELAFMYEDGTFEKDFQKAFDLFSTAAAMNYPFAMRMTATYLENGYHNAQPDPEAAFDLYVKGAAMGDINASFEAGRCYRFGIGVEENPDQAIAYYQVAAEGGNAKAMVELGLCYEHEYGVAFDAQKAFDYMQRAAELDYYYGQYKLGVYYMHGLLERDTEKAIYWLEKTDGFPQAQIELGDYYMYDYDELDEPEKAFAYYKSAAENGGYTEGLGLCYEYGVGVEENASEAFKAYELAAQDDHTAGKYHLGRSYLDGVIVKQDNEKAFSWFHNAAQDGHVAAQYYTGSMLMEGKGTTMNKEEGLEWLNKAAEENHAEAQFDLGNCYLMEDGVEESEETAMYWFEKAAANGHEQAMKLTGQKQGR